MDYTMVRAVWSFELRVVQIEQAKERNDKRGNVIFPQKPSISSMSCMLTRTNCIT